MYGPTHQYRYHNGIYADCKFCHGKGCLACPSEADKEYERQFPNGPQPIATFKVDDPEAMDKLKRVLQQIGVISDNSGQDAD